MSTPYEQTHDQTPTAGTPEFPLSIIPVSSNKTPFSEWKHYQSHVAPVSYWHRHYNGQGYVGIICGRISQNIECIDVDEKNDPNKTIWEEYIRLIPPDLLARLIIQKTPNEGYHLIYRCPEAEIEPNQKLALHSDQKVIVETRGEGGYFCTHTIDYKVRQGVFDLKNLNLDIPVITPQERSQLLELARSLTRYIPTKPKTPFSYSIPAINTFNEQYNIIGLFTKHDWTVVKEDSEKMYLLRAGSLAAYSGYYFKDTRTFFCFSTSTPFTAGKPYNHFQVLQVLEGKDDYRTTVRLLPDLGFPVEGKAEKVTTDDVVGYLNGIGIRYDAFTQQQTHNGEIVDERSGNTIYLDMMKHFGRDFPSQRFYVVLNSKHINEHHPVLEYVEANKHRKPVGTFERWFDCLILKNPNIDKGTLLHFLKKWYVGMVAQALDGEYPNEIFLTLLSTEQGIGKTTFLRKYTLPAALQGYRVEHSLSLDEDFKVLMGQSILVIDDEMDGRTYEAEKTFKTLLSIKEHTTRLKYAHRHSKIKRRCSFAGSGNNLYVVRDRLDRRILPIEVSRIDQLRLAEIDLDDLFMEAYNLFIGGFQYSYQSGDKNALNQLYEDYIQLSDVDLILDKYVEVPLSPADRHEISNLDLVTTLLMAFPQYSKRINVPTIGKQMNSRGFESVRRGRKKISTYIISKQSRILEYVQAKDEPWLPLEDNTKRNIFATQVV